MSVPISGLTEMTTPADNDLFVIVDVATNTTKKITRANAVSGAPLPADSVDTQAIEDAAVTYEKIDFGGAGHGVWWEEIGRTTLVGAGDTISVTSIPARRYLKIIVSTNATGGTIGGDIRFNNDSGANYATRSSDNGGADGTSVSQTSINIIGNAAQPNYFVAEIENTSGIEKRGVGFRNSSASGAATAPGKMELNFKWVNTSTQISRVDYLNLSGSGDFTTGSEVIVLGHN